MSRRQRVRNDVGLPEGVRIVDSGSRGLVAMHTCLARFFPVVPAGRVVLAFYPHWPVHAIDCPLRPGDSRFSTPPETGSAG